MIPSPQQAAFYSALDGDDSIVLSARAGSGKTTSLITGAREAGVTTIFLAFNKKIVTELSDRIASIPSMTASTFHSTGFRSFPRKRKVNNDQIMAFIFDDLEELSFEERNSSNLFRSRYVISQLVSLMKQEGLGCPGFPSVSNESISAIIEHHGLDADLPEEMDERTLISFATRYFEMSLNPSLDTISFDDMLYLPLLHNYSFSRYPIVMIDEAQDSNPVRREIAYRMVANGGKLVAVGDRFQAIYGFTGANSDSMDRILKRTNAIELPLSVCWRCPRSVIELAQTWVPDIEAAPTAAQGLVREISFADMLSMLKPGDMVLCRLNAPNVSLAFALIRAGIPAKIEGRAVAKSLITLAKRWKGVQSPAALAPKLGTYLKNESIRLARSPSQFATIEDKVETLMAFIERASELNITTMPAFISFIESLFEDSEGKQRLAITLSSIHKAKGLEFPRVFWLGWSHYSAKMKDRCERDWQLQQEDNLNYVAATRAQQELYLVDPAKS